MSNGKNCILYIQIIMLITLEEKYKTQAKPA
jgi:hypothetical protein